MKIKNLIDSKPTMLYMAQTVDKWKQSYHTDKKGDIVFQNPATHANVKFTNNSLHACQHTPRGFENLPQAVEHADEIWSTWADAKQQTSVLRSYILQGVNINYVVQTQDGVILKAFAVVNSNLNKYRKGVPL